MDNVLFYDIYGIPHIPKKQFKDLSDAQQYAFEHDLIVVKRIPGKNDFQEENPTS